MEETGLTLRWPWGDLVKSLERADHAKREKHRAEISQDRNGREQATLDEWSAQADCEEIRREWADMVLGGLRLLVRQGRGDQVVQLLAEALGITELAERLTDCEDAILDLRNRSPRKGTR